MREELLAYRTVEDRSPTSNYWLVKKPIMRSMLNPEDNYLHLPVSAELSFSIQSLENPYEGLDESLQKKLKEFIGDLPLPTKFKMVSIEEWVSKHDINKPISLYDMIYESTKS